MSQSKKKIRILQIITRLHVSGPSLHAVLLTTRLSDSGHDSMLVGGPVGKGADSVEPYAERYGITPHVINELERTMNPLAIWRAYRKILQLIKTYQPDIVHTHTTTAGFLGRIAARQAGVPVIVHTLHAHPFRGYYTRWQSFLFVLMERIAARVSDSIITLSEGLRRELADRYHITRKSRITVLPLGLDLDKFAQTKRKQGDFRVKFDIPADAPLIGIVGRLVPVKNHRLFLRAAVLIHEKLPTAKFLIVGDGSRQSQLMQEAETLGLGDAVIFAGWQRDMPPIYSDLDVLVLSSWNEGTPVPIIEALAAGCPVVATRVGGVPDLLDGGKLGSLVASDDSRSLVKAVIDTLEAPPDTSHAQSTMLNRYGIDRLVKDVDSLYRGLLAKKTQ